MHNLSDEPVRIRKGDHILSMVFYELKHAVAPTDLYKGSYQHLDDLGMYCKTVKRGAIYSLARDFEKTKETLEKQLEQTKIDIAKESTNKQLAIMNVITIIIAIVTVLLTVITGFLTVNTFRNPDNEGEETAFEQETIVDDNNKISIGSYKIEIKSGNIVNVTVDETGKEILIDIGMDGETE